MSRITDTPLFKAIAPHIKSITRQQLAKELAIVKKGYHIRYAIGWHHTTINSAFDWSLTPQGYLFWDTLSHECHKSRIISHLSKLNNVQ